MIIEDLFMAPEDLFRLGNSTSPRLTNARIPKDINVIPVNGISVVVANGKGISLSTKSRLNKSPMSGWVWMIPHGTSMPNGLKLLNDRDGHFTIAPVVNMPLDQFKGLLSSLALHCKKVYRKDAVG